MTNPSLHDLHDIHLPTPINPWPPAIGWFILASLLAILTIWGSYKLYWYWRKSRAKRAALKELASLRNQSSSADIFAKLSQILRRLTIYYYAQDNMAGVYGEAWLNFLDRTGKTDAFSRGEGRILASAPYEKNQPADAQSLIQIVELWIKKAC